MLARTRSIVALVGVVGGLMGTADLAHAAPPAPQAHKGARITWVRGIDAERCVGRAGLEEDVKARLGYDPFTLPSEIAIEGTIVRVAPAGFRAEIVVRDPSGKTLGTRQLASRDIDCRSLGDAVAVAITVAIDPDAPGTRAPVVEEAPFVAVGEPPPPPPAPPPPVSERVHAMLTGGASVGLLPDVAPSTSLRVRAIVAPWIEIGIGAHVWPESQTKGFGFAIASGSLDACAMPLAGARLLRWCAAIHGGVFDVFVHAAELAPVDVGAFAWAAAESGPVLSIPVVGALRLEIGVSAFVPILRRQAFVRGQSEPLWEQSVVGGRAEVGVGATF